MPIKDIHILPLTPVVDADGTSIDTAVIIKDLLETYNPANLHEAPIVVGHCSDDPFILPRRDSEPAYGWVTSLILKPDGLYARSHIQDSLAEWIGSEPPLLKHQSLALYQPENPLNPTPGRNHLRHVALLGAQPPLIKGLEPLGFSEGDKCYTILSLVNTNTKHDTMAKTMAEPPNVAMQGFISLIKSATGFTGDVKLQDFNPEVIFGNVSKQIVGQFADNTGTIYDFTLNEAEDGTYSGTCVALPIETVSPMPEPEAEGIDGAIEVQDTLNQSLDESTPTQPMDDPQLLAALKQNQELLAQIAEMRITGLNEYAESLYKKGVLTTGVVPKEQLVKFLTLIDVANPEPQQFSEGGQKQTPLDWFKNFLTKLPTMVTFGEVAPTAIIVPPAAGTIQRTPIGAVQDKDALALDAQVRSFCETKNWDPKNSTLYEKALRHVMTEVA